MQGKVKWFSKVKKYGFITGEDGNDYFVHQTEIKMDGFRFLKQGEDVTFEVQDSEKGKEAKGVERVA